VTASVATRICGLFNAGIPQGDNWLSMLLKNELDQLPMPGAGATLARWRALAAVGQFDLSLTKLYEGHTDALAILAEIGQPGAHTAQGAWCVWAAEAPAGRTLIHAADRGGVRLSGAKHWCSGAITGDHALLTAWSTDGSGPHLVAIELKQPGIAIDATHWKAVGMAGSMSVNVAFDGAKGQCVGAPGQYLNRPGFWHGGAGLAACWYGSAVGIASVLRASLVGNSNDAAGYKLAALGKTELALDETAATLRQAAAWIDENPMLDASQVALTARLSAEKCAKLVIDEAGKAMGAAPFCLNEKFAQAVADLPVFIRQSHADRDFAALGESSLKRLATAWTL
jgi:alkylation response protein AidB-like acyl-CoA dehydrogenase